MWLIVIIIVVTAIVLIVRAIRHKITDSVSNAVDQKMAQRYNNAHKDDQPQRLSDRMK